MSGVRLRHPDLRGVTFTVRHPGRPLRFPMLCGVCKKTHSHKTYHLQLDHAGEVVVSETIYNHLKDAELDPLVCVGVERDPEPIYMDLGKGTESFRVVEREA